MYTLSCSELFCLPEILHFVSTPVVSWPLAMMKDAFRNQKLIQSVVSIHLISSNLLVVD